MIETPFGGTAAERALIGGQVVATVWMEGVGREGRAVGGAKGGGGGATDDVRVGVLGQIL